MLGADEWEGVAVGFLLAKVRTAIQAVVVFRTLSHSIWILFS